MILLSGIEPYFVRLPNLLAFVLYAYSSFRVSKDSVISESAFFIPLTLLFVVNPYLLDFFGLTRGYGLSIALLTYSLSCIIRGFQRNKSKEISKAVLFSALAAYANFTVLVFFASIVILAALYFLLQKKKVRLQLIKLSLFCLFYFALIIRPIMQMQVNNEFKYWKSDGFVENTISPLLRNYIYDSKVLFFQVFNFLFVIILLVTILNVILMFLQLKKEVNLLKLLSKPLFITSFVLFTTVLVNTSQHLILKTPYFENRTALFYMPLFTATLVALISFLLKNRRTVLMYSISSIFSIILLLQLFLNIKLDEVREWSYDKNTNKVFNYISENETETTLETDWMFNPSFSYYKYNNKYPLIDIGNYQKELNIETVASYYYVYSKDYLFLKKNYIPVLKFENQCWLLKRKE